MQDSLKHMFSVRDHVRPTRSCLMISLNVFILKYTYFIFKNDSGLDKEEKIKIKCYFSLLFHFWENLIRRNR